MIRWIESRGPALLVALAVAALASAVLLIRPGLRRDYRLEAFIASHDESYETYRRFCNEFTTNEVAVIVLHTENALSPPSTALASNLLEQCRLLPAVEQVQALAMLPPWLLDLLGNRLRQHRLVQDNLLSRDGRTASIILQMSGEGAAAADRRQTVSQLRAIVRRAQVENPAARIILTGPYVTLIDMYNYVDRDLLVFSIAAFSLLSIMLWIVFANPAPVAYALLVGACATLLTLGLAIVLNISASLITQMIVTLVMVLSVANCVHLAVAAEETAAMVHREPRLCAPPACPTALKGRDQSMPSIPVHPPACLPALKGRDIPAQGNALGSRPPADHPALKGRDSSSPQSHVATEAPAQGGQRTTALAAATLRRTLNPSFAAMATTAASFASVAVSSIAPVRSFGLLMAAGILLAMIAAWVGLIPLTPRLSPERELAYRPLHRLMGRLVYWASRRAGFVIGGFTLAAAVSLVAFPRLRSESDFVKSFRRHSDVRTSYEFLETHLSPVGSLEAVVRTADGGTILTPDNVLRARDLGDRLVAEHPAIFKAMTIADPLCLLTDQLPTDPADLQTRMKFAETVFGPDFLRNFINADHSAMRINLRVTESIPVDEKLALADAVEREVRRTWPAGFQAQLTGLYHFYAHLVAGLVRAQYSSLGLTTLAVYLFLAASLRSWWIGAVAMIPNILPVLYCLGAMAAIDVPIDMTTAMMVSVTLGISVDSTVHFLYRFRRELRARGSYPKALIATGRTVGRANLFTAVVITGGFWILVLSQFLPTAYFGGLIGFTLLAAFAADTLLLPVLIARLQLFGRSPNG